MGITVYTTTLKTNRNIHNHQEKILHFLDAKNIKYENIDLSVHTEARHVMLERIPEERRSERMLPPQVFSDSEYCGDFECFFKASEMGLEYTFFKLEPPPDSREEKQLRKLCNDGVEINFQ